MICIYGAGRYGIEIYYLLNRNKVSIDFFVDKDENKWGYILEDMYCISPEELLSFDRNETIIIISLKSSANKLIEYFKEKGFNRVYGKEEITKVLALNSVKDKIDAIQDIEYLNVMKQKLCDVLYLKKEVSDIDDKLRGILEDYKKRNR